MRAPVLTLKRARKLRRRMTLPETILWQSLRGNKLRGLRFRRQHPIGPYILDFFSSAARLAIEIDGTVHEQPDRIQRDARRDAWLTKHDVHVLRFAAGDILDDDTLAGVLSTIADAAAPSTTSWSPSPASRGRNLQFRVEAPWLITFPAGAPRRPGAARCADGPLPAPSPASAAARARALRAARAPAARP
jgi:very-short-patch-repair endonuclease